MIRETTPRNSRVYMRIEDAGHGMMRLAFSLTPPSYDDPAAVLIARGVLPMGQPLSLLVVSDPTQDASLRGLPGKDGDPGSPGKDGTDGASAYQLARANGYGGTQTQWLASLVGAAGLSAYDVAKAAGFAGTQAQWLSSLKGKDASAYLGTIAVGQTATVAIAAGPRRLALSISADLGVAAGDPLYLAPTQALAAYVIHDVVAVSSTQLSIGLTGPLLAIGASFSISCKLFRLTS